MKILNSTLLLTSLLSYCNYFINYLYQLNFKSIAILSISTCLIKYERRFTQHTAKFKRMAVLPPEVQFELNELLFVSRIWPAQDTMKTSNLVFTSSGECWRGMLMSHVWGLFHNAFNQTSQQSGLNYVVLTVIYYVCFTSF